MENKIKENLDSILKEINSTCKISNRDPKTVRLIAVSKRQPIEKIKQAIKAGIKHFGENRIQDAYKRWTNFDLKKLNLSFIGPLQTNKCEEAVELFNEIQSLDREKLARGLSKAENKLNKKRSYLIQVNTGNESQKSGIKPNEVDGFINLCKVNYGLNVTGLMCIPPINENPALHFAYMYKISKKNCLKDLSIGMSGDYLTAIEFGATHIRLGTALFGVRLDKEEN